MKTRHINVRRAAARTGLESTIGQRPTTRLCASPISPTHSVVFSPQLISCLVWQLPSSPGTSLSLVSLVFFITSISAPPPRRPKTRGIAVRRHDPRRCSHQAHAPATDRRRRNVSTSGEGRRVQLVTDKGAIECLPAGMARRAAGTATRRVHLPCRGC
ncbi:uncharacterized protein B0H18DRAFT_478642 [Fomitopsis serialis]|uniref:uncharacterized protein n=1 Tax=Fomitopsis serialis TaxID=139415 RepID=UPI002007F8CF|nr:uncharacterized protein B0H18DRAFT_478642 [Neoantrodia serialis]KAH9923052.1 hypothetical protein B0H18DRAFT_478642 [Neoantrodia serialis]